VTLPALDSWEVRGVLGPAYRVAARCSSPFCTKLTDHAHHIVRRTALGRPYDWIEITLDEGATVVLGNVTGLCLDCHNRVTGDVGGHQAAIRLDIETMTFNWCMVSTRGGLIEYEPLAPLYPQPPSAESLAAQPAESAPETDGVCPACGHVTRRRSETTTKRASGRRRKSWLIKVPDDSEEDGADVLDVLVDDLSPLLGYQPHANVRYHTVAAALYYAHQNVRASIEAISGRGA
jgi:hypothetical protein